MSEERQITVYEAVRLSIKAAQPKFMAIVADESEYSKEAAFAMTICTEGMRGQSSKFWKELLMTERGQDSLREAVADVARRGVSLNPSKKEAYIVPRDGKICLDISYKGLINLAVKDGLVMMVIVEVVCKDEEFEFSKAAKEPPKHSYKPFSSQRNDKNIIGAYCSALLPSGYWVTEVMSIDEINKVKSCAKTKTVWDGWFGEMCKKTIIKRAAKMWCGTTRDTRLESAIEYANEYAGEGIEILQHQTAKKADRLLETKQPAINALPESELKDNSFWNEYDSVEQKRLTQSQEV